MPQAVTRLLRGPFTVEDYHRLEAVGVLREGARTELLDGQVVEMSPIGSRHAGTVNRVAVLFARAALAGRATVAVQNPVVLDDRSEPQPDVAVLKHRSDGYVEAHPRPEDVLLLIEVSDSTVEKDREIKLPLYARAGIAQVWLVDLRAGTIEDHRDPSSNGYASVQVAGSGASLDVLLLPDLRLSVREILT